MNWKKLKCLFSLQNEIKTSRLQDKLKNQNLHEDMEEVFELGFKTIEESTEDITITLMVTSKENSKILAHLQRLQV